MAANEGRHEVSGDAGANGESPSLAADPLSRLEAELGAAGRQPESERLHEETWKLLEEAWSLVTECLVIRDGLLEACREVERTMGGLQDRLGAMAATIDPESPRSPTAAQGPRADEPIASSGATNDVAR
jgi:hypothetical protein